MRVQRYDFLLNCLRFAFQKLYVFLSCENRGGVKTWRRGDEKHVSSSRKHTMLVLTT